MALYEKGVINGYGNGSFGPDNQLTRAEALKIALIAFDHPVSSGADHGFRDVDANAWYAVYVAAGKSKGVVNGYADGTFKPDDEVSRAEALKILAVAAGIDLSTLPNGEVIFRDTPQTAWFTPIINWAKNNAIVDGYADGSFGADRPVTRAEFTKIAYLTMQMRGK